MSRTIEELEKQMKMLRLHGMAQTVRNRLLQARQERCDIVEILSILIQDELDGRQSRLTERRFHASGLDERKTMEDFDWAFNSKLPKREIFDLISVKFLQNGEDAILIGHPGTGKSHVAKAVAHAAILAGYQAVYRNADTLFEDCFEAGQTGKRKKIFKLFSESDLLVIDDLFLQKNNMQTTSEDLLKIVLERYRNRKSTIITSNRPVEDWGKLLKDNAAASAILDRLLHRGNLLKFEGKSYRLREASKRLASLKNNP